MTERQSVTVRLGGLAMAAMLLFAACGGGPQSEAVESVAPTSAPTQAPATEAPATAEPATEAPSAAAPATPSPTPGVPPKPTDVTWTFISETVISDTTLRETYHLTWSSPDGVATQFVIYGVKDCLRYSARNNGKPCVVKGMKIPSKSLVLLTKVPGALRATDVLWDKEGGAGPEPYSAVLIRAVNAVGKSIFAIAWSANVCFECTY